VYLLILFCCCWCCLCLVFCCYFDWFHSRKDHSTESQVACSSSQTCCMGPPVFCHLPLSSVSVSVVIFVVAFGVVFVISVFIVVVIIVFIVITVIESSKSSFVLESRRQTTNERLIRLITFRRIWNSLILIRSLSNFWVGLTFLRWSWWLLFGFVRPTINKNTCNN